MTSDSTCVSVCMTVPSRADIHAITQIHAEMVSLYKRCDALTIDLSTSQSVDLTLIQLVESLRRSALRDGKTVSLSTTPAQAVQEMLLKGGFLETRSARDFWT